ncbi:30S ribosomal protein S24e [uncultured archaeon]|nr:30S ribosomal protein S24e [uncultured archaeon]
MNISIESKTNNALLGRTDVSFALTFEGAVPSRKQVREALSMALSVPADRLAVVRLDSSFGTHAAKGLCHLYPTPEAALKGEKAHILVRDGLKTKEEKKKEEKKAPAKK